MDDLISRGALIEQLEKQCGKNTYIIPDFAWETIENAPTAFNKEKVIEELKYDKEMSKKYSTGLREQGHVEAFDEAISIVKKGGINNILL